MMTTWQPKGHGGGVPSRQFAETASGRSIRYGRGMRQRSQLAGRLAVKVSLSRRKSFPGVRVARAMGGASMPQVECRGHGKPHAPVREQPRLVAAHAPRRSRVLLAALAAAEPALPLD